MYPIHRNNRVLVTGILRMDFLFTNQEKNIVDISVICYCICEILVQEIKSFEKSL